MMLTIFRHVMNPVFLGLCPVCWLFILAIVVLTILLFRLLRSRDRRKEETRERTAYDQNQL